MESCGYCKEREVKTQKSEDDLKKKTMIECKKALEREKISKGMQSTRMDEMELRAMQKLQMKEKKYMEKKSQEMEYLWHQEEAERRELLRLKEEMRERRKSYDEQISSAKRERQETLKREREQENKRLEKMRQKMEQDYYNAFKRKREQQAANRSNYIEGHEMKLSRIELERNRERAVDVNCISAAVEELRRENQQKKDKMRALKQQEAIFMNYHQREKNMARVLEDEAHKMVQEWSTRLDKQYEERLRQEDATNKIKKEKALTEYRQHIENVNQQSMKERMERRQHIERVNRTAYSELERRLNSAEEELRRQNEYRNNLTEQIKLNQTVLETELKNVERKQRAFTKEAIMFKEAMRDKINIRKNEQSTNPVHPFQKVIKKQQKYEYPLLPNL
ncbi:unnamed protein product, partial [Iphiclides podalirius]